MEMKKEKNKQSKKEERKEVENTFSKDISEYLVPFKRICLKEFKSRRMWVTLIAFVGGILLSSGYIISGLFLVIFPFYLNRRFEEKQRKKNTDGFIKEIAKDSELKDLFLTLLNAPQETHTFDDKFEKAEWINDILKRIWPYYNATLQDELDRKGYTIKKDDGKGIDIGGGQFLHFERITLGDKPPVVTHIGRNEAATRLEEELVVEIKVLYFGNCLISIKKTSSCFPIRGGIKDVCFQGNARIVLRPLMNKYPYFGGISFCLLERPVIDYEGINLVKLTDNRLLRNFLMSKIESILVAPNKLYFALKDDPEIRRQLKFAPPIGLCYFEIIEAENLPRQGVVPVSTLHPLCVIRVGSTEFKTLNVLNSLNPYWGESHSAPIHDYFDQFKISIYNKAIIADYLVGSVEFQLKDIMSDKEAHGRDKWVPIGKSVSGAIHFRVSCFRLKREPSTIPLVTQKISESKQRFPLGILSVYIYHLQIAKAEGKNVVPVIHMKYNGQSFQTQPVEANEPLQFDIEESYSFICNNPNQEILEVTALNSSDSSNFINLTRIGTCVIQITEVIRDKQAFLQKTCNLLVGNDTRDVKGTVKLYLCFQIVDIDNTVYDNLQAPYDIKCNVNQVTSESSFFRRLIMQPVDTIRHPIEALESLKNTMVPFVSQKAVKDDLSPTPPSLKNDCHIQMKMKWPERKYLVFEILRVVNIPTVYRDPIYKFSIVIKLGRLMTVIVPSYTKGRLIAGKGSFASKKTSRYRSKIAGSVIFNEILEFKVDSSLPIENYGLHITLMAHKRKSIICTDSNEVAWKIMKMPSISFRSDPIEQWYKLGEFD